MDGFVFLRSFLEAIEKAPEENQLGILKSVIKYGLDGVVPDDIGWVESMVLDLVKPTIDKQQRKYKANAENGSKGGAPEGNSNAKKQPKTTQNNPKQPNIIKQTTQNNPKQPKTTLEKEKEKEKEKELEKEYEKELDNYFLLGAVDNATPRKPEVFIQIPLNGGQMHDVTFDDVMAMQSLYPATNAEQVFRDIVGWNMANPTKRKTKRGINSHINSWFQREQNKPHPSQNTHASQTKKSNNPFAELAGMI